MKKAIIFAAIFAASLILPVHASPTVITYNAKTTSNWSEGLNAFNITTTLAFTAFFDCIAEGTTCHIDATQGTANLTINYNLTVLGIKTDGSYNTQAPTIIGDSSDMPIPPPPEPPVITISIHGHIIGKPTVDIGTANPSQLTWTSWGRQNTNVSTEATILTLNTTHSFYMTITLLGIITQNSTTVDTQGVPIPNYPIPEYMTILAPLCVATMAILLLRAAAPKLHAWPKSKNPLSACDSKAHPKHLQNSDRKQRRQATAANDTTSFMVNSNQQTRNHP